MLSNYEIPTTFILPSMSRNMASILILSATIPHAMAAGAPPLTAHQQETAARMVAENKRISKYIVWTWLAIVGTLLVYRITRTLLQHVRRLANLNHGTNGDGRQRYFTIPHENWAKLKRYWITAPLFRKRHNREFRLSAAVNVGTLPTRLQTFFLVGYLVMNAVFCAMTIDWSDKTTFYASGRNRTGILATLNVVPLFVLAGRNNPLIWLLDISFDTYNLIHRWVGRIVVLEAVAHTAFWMGSKISTGKGKGWSIIAQSFTHSAFIQAGLIGVCAFILLLLQSPSIVRHAFYETFLHIHIALVVTAVAGVWIHLADYPDYRTYLLAAVALWIIERFFRLCSLIRRNIGRKITRAEVEVLPGDALRVTLRMTRPWKFQPGQHIYLYMPSVGLWTSHPFSVAWSSETHDTHSEKPLPVLPVSALDVLAPKITTMSLIVRRRTGFTDTLYRKAEATPSGRFSARAFVEGPYGSENFQSYGTVMLFAAGVGITHQVPHVRDLVAAYSNGTCATRKVVLTWIIQSPEHLEWIRPWMTEILAMDKRRDVLKILLFITRPRSIREIRSPSASVQMFPGKPDVGALIAKEQEKQIGAMAISVCGTGSLSDDVRRAMRDRCEVTEMDLFEEAFSW